MATKADAVAPEQAEDAGPAAGAGFFWCEAAGVPCADVHVGFRATLKLPAAATVLIDHVAVSWYNVYVDGERTAEGPTRFTGQAPYYQRSRVSLAAGEHVIAMHVHSAGVQTRTLLLRPPAAFCRATTADGKPLPLAWVCRPLSAGGKEGHVTGGIPLYKSQWNRISVLLGWAENATVTSEYGAWFAKDYSGDLTKWKPVTALAAAKSYEAPLPLESVAGPASSVRGTPLGAMATGTLWNRYGYVDDDPPARSFLRKLVAEGEQDTVPPPSSSFADGVDGIIPGDDYGPAQGRWWRFDLGKCRLTRLELTVRAPAGVVFEVSYAQELLEGRVSPWMTLCGSTSCYLDRYTLGADVAHTDVTICPLEPRGCRYIEVHAVYDALPIQPDPAGFLAQIQLVAAVPLFRGYAGMQAEPAGAWSSEGDTLLNRIWRIGIETTRSCTEDTAIDGPCRERGQWTGDTLAVTLQNVAACYADVRALKLCLLQSSSADGVDKNGMISGNCPENTYPLDYVFIWFSGAIAYYKATGDKPLLQLLFPRAQRCLDFIVGKTTAAGLKTSETGCGQVVDWGYRPPSATTAGGVDITINCFYLLALEAMNEWCTVLGKDGAKYGQAHGEVSAAMTKRLTAHAAMQQRQRCEEHEQGQEQEQEQEQDDDGWVVVHEDEREEGTDPNANAETEAHSGEGPAVAAVAEDLSQLEGLDWSTIGYHAASMALAAGLLGPPPKSNGDAYQLQQQRQRQRQLQCVTDESAAAIPERVAVGERTATAAEAAAQAACIGFIKAHLAACFPNDRSAPRAANPSCANPKLYTPYYATFSFPPMIEYGELDWVLGQYRSAWGWAATQSSTWLEVFDGRWEKVHSWSGCPTWQLTMYTLGLAPRYDVGARHFDLQLYAAESLLSAGVISGRVPCREGDALTISWRNHEGHYAGDDSEIVAAAEAVQQVTVDYTITTSPGAAAVFVSGWAGGADDGGDTGDDYGGGGACTRASTWTKIEGTMSCRLVLPVSASSSPPSQGPKLG